MNSLLISMKIWLKFILEKMNKKSIILDVLAVLSSRPFKRDLRFEFEGIAKTNTTHTLILSWRPLQCLRVLLKQIQHTNSDQSIDRVHKF